MPTVPTEHVTDSQKLIGADGMVELLVLELTKGAGTLRLKDNGEATWLGDIYEYIPWGISGVDYKSGEEESRPLLKLANPDHIFSSSIEQGYLERAGVTRYRLLRHNFENDRDIKEERRWYVRRVVDVTGTHVACELSNLIDGPNYVLPARSYVPPEFAVVSLG